MNRKFLLITLGIIGAAGLLIYLLLPFPSAGWEIATDEKSGDYKRQFLAAPPSSHDSVARPNIIILLADDLGKTDISLYGGRKVQTPFIDGIGKDGVIFSDGYVTAPICAPSRASLLTGRYNQRFGFEIQPQRRYPRNRLEYLAFKYVVDTDDWHVADGTSYPSKEDIREQGLPKDEITLAEVLRKEGYATGMVGKWHLGYTDGYKPNDRGFDFHYGFYEAYSWFADTSDHAIVNSFQDEFTDKHIWKGARKDACAIRINDSIIEEKEYLTFAFAREANHFIRRHRDGPFFLYVPFNAPHTPFQAPRDYYDMFAAEKDHHKRVYYAMIKALDDAVGSILRTLKEEGLDENTIIYFASDNGGATYTGATDNAPLKGGKLSNFEGGINVPYMMRWKGKILPGQLYRHPVSLLDIFVTSANAAHADLPARVIDGMDLMAFIGDTSKTGPHPDLYWRTDYNKAIRKHDWKLIIDEKNKIIQLYNLAEDRSEKINLHRELPDIVESLKADLQKWESGMRAPLWPRIMDYTFKIGNEIYYFAV